MTTEDRITIATELNNHSTFKEIGKIINKDCTTISKEIRKHRTFEQSGAPGKAFNDCEHTFQHKCSLKSVCERCTSYRKNRLCWSCAKCIDSCLSYQKHVCSKLSKPPYVCNGCDSRYNCTLEKAFYKAANAQSEYKQLLSESRSGFAVSEQELESIDDVVSPLLLQGHSLHHISIHHADELMVCERSLYTYVNHSLLSARNIDMPRVVRMRPRKNKSKALKIDKACRINRTYDDFLEYMKLHPDLPVRQLDSVEGVRGGAVLLTIHFVEQQFQLSFLRKSNNSQSVIDIFERLYLELRSDIFIELFPVILADNGSEFSNPTAIELDKQENPRTKMFYCNPSAPYEKGACENNHEFIRRIIPKGIDLGQFTQEQIDLMMSHINSYSRPKLGNKSPYEMMVFQYGERIMDVFNIQKIPTDEIILTPELFK